MGLHLCYELSLPARTSSGAIAAHVAQLHERAITLPIAQVSSIVSRHDFDPDLIEGPQGLSFRQLEDVVGIGARSTRDNLYRRSIGVSPDDPRIVEAPDGTRIDVIAFAVAPGRGSEPATFGFARLANRNAPSDWHWQAWCKTQYASAVSDDHLVRCHTSLVRLLDAARESGVHVEVHDETEYWASRDPQLLVEKVREMNRIIARFAGKLNDALRDTEPGREGLTTGGAIFDHPDFERLETED